MLRKTLLIAKREYLERLRSKFFRVTTVLVPVGMAALVALGTIGGKKIENVQHVAVVSSDPVLAGEVRNSLEHGRMAPASVDVISPVTDAERATLNQDVAAHRIDGYLEVETPAGSAPQATWISATSVNFVSKAELEAA